MDRQAPDPELLESLPKLIAAAARGDLDAVSDFLGSGVDPNQADDDGWTALHAAAVFDHPSVVALLLEGGALVDARTKDGFTPLLNAARASAEVVSALLAAGADPSAQEVSLGWRPLDRFAGYGNLAGVQLVLEARAEVNARDFSGGTALMDAAEIGDRACVELLLQYGADPALTNEDRETASSLAAAQGQQAVAELLATQN